MIRVLEYPADLVKLRKKAKRVKNIQSPEVKLAISAMKFAADEWEQRTGGTCEGLAATQVGIPLRIVLIRITDTKKPRNPDMVPNNSEVYTTERDYLDALWHYKDWVEANPNFDPYLVMINPVYITTADQGMQDSEEACMSVPGIVVTTLRPEKAVFHYYDETGKRVPEVGPDLNKPGELVASGFSAACIAHELDHLNGVLNIDAAFDIRESTDAKAL